MTKNSDRGIRNIGFLLFSDMLQLDFTGPYGVLAQIPGVTLHLLAKTLAPIVSSDGLIFQPTAEFADHPALDIIVVPGGGGVTALMEDVATLAFLRDVAVDAGYVASVCTGALVLGAAGLLRNRRATTHWQSVDLLPLFGAVPVRERVVVDKTLITAAGVTSGIDMALTLAGLAWNVELAQSIQLGMEYSPRPPFDSGSPDSAPAAVRQAVVDRNAGRHASRKAAARAAAQRLGIENNI